MQICECADRPKKINGMLARISSEGSESKDKGTEFMEGK